MEKERKIGTVVRGLRAPIIREGDDLKKIVLDVLGEIIEDGDIVVGDRDVLCITEAVVARAQGNYATVDQISQDVKRKMGSDSFGVILPILSRNRFAVCLRGIARGAEKIVLMLSYPGDEVGNHLIALDQLDKENINPYSDTLDLATFRRLFGEGKHKFTGVDYVSYYKKLVEDEGAECQVIFSNNPKTILDYTSHVLTCDIHTRARTKRILEEAGADVVVGLEDILNESVDGSGYNKAYGLLGSNKASEDMVKLFPNDCTSFVKDIQKEVLARTGKHIEVMVYGDGAFKDPVGKIWELADPVVSPGFTEGLVGTPNELKLKYLADNDFKDLSGQALKEAISNSIRNKEEYSMDTMASQGTTPRNLTDLLGSLSDLTSGSGDKGTPFVYIQGYFDNYTK